MLWHLRNVTPREEHQFFNLADLFRWFRDWSRVNPELAMPDLPELDQLLDSEGAELSSFIRAESASEALRLLRDRILRLGIGTLARARELHCDDEQLLASSFLSGEAAFTRRFKKPIRGAREGTYSALLEDSILRLTHESSAFFLRRQTQSSCELELTHWGAVIRAAPQLETPLRHWLAGYLSKFRPTQMVLRWDPPTLRLELNEIPITVT